MAVLIFFFSLLLVALPLGEASRITLGLTVSFTILDMFVVAGSLLWFMWKLRKKQFVFSKLAKLFFVLTGVFIISLLANVPHLTVSQSMVSGLYIVRWFCYGLLFFMAAASSQKIKKNISLFLLIGGTLTLLGGYVQYFFYPSLRNLIYFGWDEHFYRMFGSFFDPNFYGLFLVLFFLYAVSRLFLVTPQKQKYLFVALFLVSSASFMGVLLTYSRTALIALIVGLLVLFWQKKFWKVLAGGVVAIVVVALVFFTFSNKKTDMNSLFRITSSDARLGSAKNALTIFLDSPLIGVGFNAYRYSVYKHGFQSGSSIQEDHGASGADSSLLLVLATSGIIGFGTFLLFWWQHVRSLSKKSERLGLATLGAFFVGSLFVNGLFYPLLLVWVWTVLGVTTSE